MKFELRYLDRKSGRKVRAGSPGGRDTFDDVRETVLQYRLRYDETTATQWQDVPTVKEEDDES